MITQTIDHDYIPYENQRERLEAFHSFLSKIFREPEVLMYVVSVLGRALLGDTSSCDLSGQNGKTTPFHLLSKALGPNYFCELRSNGLDSNYEANWTATSITKNHRILYWDEPTPRVAKSSAFFKGVCNGSLSARGMGSDIDEKKIIRAKLFITANNIILFDSDEGDGGIERRFHYYSCKNKFSRSVVDEKNFIYGALPLGDRNYIPNHCELMTIFDYFAYFAKLPLVQRPDRIIVSANKLYELVKYFLIRDGSSMICFPDFYCLIEKLFPFHQNDEKKIIKMLETLGISYYPQKSTMDINGMKKKRVLFGAKWRPEALEILKNGRQIDFVFSELPDEPVFKMDHSTAIQTYDEPPTEEMESLMLEKMEDNDSDDSEES